MYQSQKIIFTLILLLLAPYLVLAKESFSIFDSKIFFEIPNKELWKPYKFKNDFSSNNIGYIMYKRTPVINPQNIPIEPVISVLYQKIPVNSDLILYSTNLRIKTPFEVTKLILPDDIEATYPNAIIYEGSHVQENVKHTVLIAHMIYKDIGVQVICDSTEDVYKKVKEDMMEFIKSVDFK